MAKEQTSLVKYGGFDLDEAAEQAEDLDKNKGGSDFLQLGQGKTVVRFIPPLEGRKWCRVTYVHYIDVPGVGRVRFVCPLMEAKKKCRVCDKGKKLAASDKKIDQDRAKKLRPKRRVYANILPRKSEEGGAKVLGFGPMIEDQLLKIRQDEDDGGDFVHPVKGFDIAIIRSGTTQNDTEYRVIPANKGKVLPLLEDSKAMGELISSQVNLEQYIKVYDDEDIEKILNGEKPGQEGEEGGGRRQAKKKAADEIEEEDEEIEIDDE